MIKVHDIENYLAKQVKKNQRNQIFLIEDSIEQAHQSRNIDKRRIGNMSDKRKAAFSHSKVESARLNGDVKKHYDRNKITHQMLFKKK